VNYTIDHPLIPRRDAPCNPLYTIRMRSRYLRISYKVIITQSIILKTIIVILNTAIFTMIVILSPSLHSGWQC